MPNVDFTLDDIAKQTEGIVAAALVAERVHTRKMVTEIVREEVGEQVQQSEKRIIGHFQSFIENNFEPAIDSLQTQIGEINVKLSQMDGRLTQVEHNTTNSRAIIDEHTKDIMELRARRA